MADSLRLVTAANPIDDNIKIRTLLVYLNTKPQKKLFSGWATKEKWIFNHDFTTFSAI